MKQLTALLQTKYPAIIWTILIFILCTLPSKHLPDKGDKTLHFIAFAGFTFFWLFQSTKYWAIILVGVIYGIGIEYWQAILPASFHRGFDWYDALADSVGAIIGFPIYLIFNRLTKLLNR